MKALAAVILTITTGLFAGSGPAIASSVPTPAPPIASVQQSPTARGDVVTAMTKKQQKLALIKFNGYYTLDNAPGAFFFIDTNEHVSRGGASRKYVISLVLSLDGTTSKSVNFNGQFDGKRLIQQERGKPRFNVILKRKPNKLGPTASVSGQFTMPGQASTTTSGVTYDDPIPASFWGDHTYYTQTTTPGQKLTPAVKIGKEGDLFFRKGTTRKPWVKIKSYRYNLDMYYFKFPGTALVMGTAAQSGMTINDMTQRGGKTVSQRSLVTNPRATAPTTGVTNWYPNTPGSAQLSDYSGYYSIATRKHPRAFISIQGENLAAPELTSDYLSRVLISVSLDGTSVQSWYYDTAGQMSFANGVLKMPAQNITLRFKRQANRKAGSLFSMKGKVQNRQVSGTSRFNSIPLSVFAGTMTDKAGQHTLVITEAGDVSLDGVVIPDYQYVPTMYILAGPITDPEIDPQPVTVLSLGYSGKNGKTAIVTTDAGGPAQSTFTLTAIP